MLFGVKIQRTSTTFKQQNLAGPSTQIKIHSESCIIHYIESQTASHFGTWILRVFCPKVQSKVHIYDIHSPQGTQAQNPVRPKSLILYIYICIYMYVYTRTYTRTYIRTYIHTYTHTSIHPHIHTSIHASENRLARRSVFE